MRTIAVRVPEKCSTECPLAQSNLNEEPHIPEWHTCYHRKNWTKKLDQLKPTKACKEATIGGE